ncbi:MAG: hypothetical protein PHI97_08960 [Desulfobulbus sp.]|nr:hypothetical protein [Desulfobulbus sp.]
MKKTLLTTNEYIQLGIQFTGFADHISRVRRLASSAYPFKSPLFKAIARADEEGIFQFQFHLERLAYEEHPTEDFDDGFELARRKDYRPPACIPGCSPEETERMASAFISRRYEKKKTPLAVDELIIITKFFGHIDIACQEIIEKVHTLGKKSKPDAKALLKPSLIIGDALVIFFRETQRVRDEQV